MKHLCKQSREYIQCLPSIKQDFKEMNHDNHTVNQQASFVIPAKLRHPYFDKVCLMKKNDASPDVVNLT